MDVFLVTLFHLNGSPVACKGWESVLASVLLDASYFSRNFCATRLYTRAGSPRFASSSQRAPSYHCCKIFVTPDVTRSAHKPLIVLACQSSTRHSVCTTKSITVRGARTPPRRAHDTTSTMGADAHPVACSRHCQHFRQHNHLRTIAAVGDSITYGTCASDRAIKSWPAQLQRGYLWQDPTVRVLNFGASGINSR